VIGRLLCRLGWHRLEWKSQLAVYMKQPEVIYVLTKARCRREDCPEHLWWSTYDIEARPNTIEMEVTNGD
jgi:hypothetical protein